MSPWIEHILYEDAHENVAFDCQGKFVELATTVQDLDHKKYLVDSFMTLLDKDERAAEIGLPKKGVIKIENAELFFSNLIAWIDANRSYLYFHPKERRFKIDAAARTAGVPTSVYREANPWGPAEGPNLTDPAKVPSRGG
jgi:hypothetical protein